MIPTQNIVAWGNLVPWTDARQVEQDLIISRALVEIFSDASRPCQLRGGARSSAPRFEFHPFGVSQNNGNRWASRAHAHLPVEQDDGVAQFLLFFSGTGH